MIDQASDTTAPLERRRQPGGSTEEVEEDPAKTLVCGVGGITGNAVVKRLSGEGSIVRALVHREERRAAALTGGSSEVVVADYDAPRTLAAAMQGIDAVFFAAPAYEQAEPRWVAAALGAAKEAGVDKFVYHSVLHSYTPSMPHHARKAEAEAIVRSSGLGWVIVQPAMYAQSVLRMRSRSPKGELNVPYDPGALFSLIDVQDVAACIGAVLRSGQHHLFGSYEIAGPEIAPLRDLIAEMNRIFDEERRLVRVNPETVPLPASWGRRHRQEFALMCEEYGRNGLYGSSSVTRALLGSSPATFSQVLTRERAETDAERNT